MAEPSIRRQLLAWLLIPLCILFLFSSAFAYFLACTVSNYTYDRALVKAAASVAARLDWTDEGVSVDMPPAAQAILRFSDDDKVYYQVLKQDETRISGDAVIPGPVQRPFSNEPGFRDATLDGVPIRIARIRCINPKDPADAVLVQTAETLRGRQTLTNLLVLSVLAPQILLIVFSSLAVWFGIGKGLTTLGQIQKSVKSRNPHDLSALNFSAVPTEIKPLVEALNDLLDRLRHEIEAQQRFVANAAHQLRTPLAGLRTYVGITQRLTTDARIISVVEQFDNGIDRMAHLVDRLLSLAKAEPHRERTMDRTIIDLNFVASDAINTLVELALSKNIELLFECAQSPALMIGNKESLRDLASNLIENAILYTPDGGTVKVRVDNGSKVNFTVMDDGPGIAPEERERVFERFYRILGSNVTGSGLGLSIVKEIALAHSAVITLEGRENRTGTVITVSFDKAVGSTAILLPAE